MSMGKQRLWTAWCDYEATGEGQTLMVWIGYAGGKAQAKAAFRRRFGEFHARHCDAKAGVVSNDVTLLLVPADTLAALAIREGKAQIDVFSQLHLNGA